MLNWPLRIPLFIVSVSALIVIATAKADDSGGDRVLTAERTGLYERDQAQLKQVTTISPLTRLEIVPTSQKLTDTSGTTYRPVRARGDQRIRWVREVDLLDLPHEPRPRRDVPALIARQPATVQDAWTEVDTIIRDNEAAKTPIAHAYLARAEIWAVASGYDAAVQDACTALTLSRQQGASLAEQSRILNRIQQLMKELAHAPRPRYFGEAQSHYERGFDAFHQARYEEALKHFDNAVQLAPDNKVYWYYRALTNRCLNRNAEADRDIVIAVYQERAEYEPQPRWWLSQFTRVQGSLRDWMESYRSGLTFPR